MGFFAYTILFIGKNTSHSIRDRFILLEKTCVRTHFLLFLDNDVLSAYTHFHGGRLKINWC